MLHSLNILAVVLEYQQHGPQSKYDIMNHKYPLVPTNKTQGAAVSVEEGGASVVPAVDVSVGRGWW